MGLRINTNTSSLDALRNLHMSDRGQQLSLQRLSSGLRINSGADDPSGLVISERLKSQIGALKQDSQNSQNAMNLVSTADSSLQKVSDLLANIQRSIQFALNTGGASPDQIAAEQDSVDQAVAGINRVAATTRYGDKALLNGAAAYQLAAPGIPPIGVTPAYNNLNIKSLTFLSGQTQRNLAITGINIAAGTGTGPLHAGRGSVLLGANAGAATTLRISGSLGTADITLAAGATLPTVGAAINSVADRTGVVFDGVSVAETAAIGSAETVSIQVVSGGLGAGPLTGVGIAASGRGADATLQFQGQTYTAKGLHFSINSPDASFEFDLNSDLVPITTVGAFAPVNPVPMVVLNTGLAFQLREQNTSADRMAIGISSMTAASLGKDRNQDVIATALNLGVAVNGGGFVSSLVTGAGNDLTQNAANALTIVNSAAARVAKTRGFLGAAVAFNLQPNIDSIEVATQNLSSSLSSLRDLDFAEETANFTRSQILFQSGIAALASARTIPQAVLQLLGR